MIARRRCAPVGISIAEFERNVAREEAKLAVDLEGRKNAEVIESLGEILRSLDSRR